jgi:hypothetical protein
LGEDVQLSGNTFATCFTVLDNMQHNQQCQARKVHTQLQEIGNIQIKAKERGK